MMRHDFYEKRGNAMAKRVYETEKLIEEIRKFLVRLSIKEAILFGSRIRDENLEDSDVDLILISDKFAKQKFTERFYPIHKCWELPYFLEALPYTTKELKKLAKSRGIIQEALRNGIRIRVK